MSLLTLNRKTPVLSTMFPEFFADDYFFGPTTNNGWLKTIKVPATNVFETENEFRMEIAVPGFKKEDFKVNFENGILEISSEREMNKESKEGEYTRQEYDFSSFSRTFTLPESVNPKDIRANYENGILKLVLPKKVEAKGKLTQEIKVS